MRFWDALILRTSVFCVSSVVKKLWDAPVLQIDTDEGETFLGRAVRTGSGSDWIPEAYFFWDALCVTV